MHRVLAFATLWLLVLVACGGGDLTLSEYSSKVAALVETLDGRLDAEAEEYFSGPPSVKGAREYVHVRVAGYGDFVESINTIDPPDQVAELHATFRELMNKLLVKEEARAAYADTVASIEELDEVWEGREAQAIRTIEEEAIVLCRAAQTQFDATEQREAFVDVLWMPNELKEIVRVALNCP